MTRLERKRIRAEKKWIEMASKHGLRKNFARKLLQVGEYKMITRWVNELADINTLLAERYKGE